MLKLVIFSCLVGCVYMTQVAENQQIQIAPKNNFLAIASEHENRLHVRYNESLTEMNEKLQPVYDRVANTGVAGYLSKKFGHGKRGECFSAEVQKAMGELGLFVDNLIKMSSLFPALIQSIHRCIRPEEGVSPRTCIQELAELFSKTAADPQKVLIISSTTLITTVQDIPFIAFKCIMAGRSP